MLSLCYYIISMLTWQHPALCSAKNFYNAPKKGRKYLHRLHLKCQLRDIYFIFIELLDKSENITLAIQLLYSISAQL